MGCHLNYSTSEYEHPKIKKQCPGYREMVYNQSIILKSGDSYDRPLKRKSIWCTKSWMVVKKRLSTVEFLVLEKALKSETERFNFNLNASITLRTNHPNAGYSPG